MKGHYTIIIKFKTTPDKKELFKHFLESVIPIALESPDCLRHDLHQSLESSVEFLFYESWVNKAAHEKHVLKREVQNWRANFGGLAFLSRALAA